MLKKIEWRYAFGTADSMETRLNGHALRHINLGRTIRGGGRRLEEDYMYTLNIQDTLSDTTEDIR